MEKIQAPTPSDSDKEEEEAQDGGYVRRPDIGSWWAHGWEAGCTAPRWKAPALLKRPLQLSHSKNF